MKKKKRMMDNNNRLTRFCTCRLTINKKQHTFMARFLSLGRFLFTPSLLIFVLKNRGDWSLAPHAD